jgi:hypothetical protein
MVAPVPTTRTLPGMALPGAAELQRLHALVPPPRVAVAKEQPAVQADPPKPGVAFLPLPAVVEPRRAVVKASEAAPGVVEPFVEDDDVDAVGPVDTARYALTPRVRRRAALSLGATSLLVIAVLLVWPSADEPASVSEPNRAAPVASAPLAKPEPTVVVSAAPVLEEPLLAPPAAPNLERIPEDETAPETDDAEARADSAEEAEEAEEDGDEPEGRTETRRQRSRRASALVSQGHDFRHRSLFGAARARYQQALEVYPGYPRAFAGLARVALMQKHGTEAVRHAKALVHARPAEASNQLLLGDAHDLAGDLRAPRMARGSEAG